jgi:DNA polymerase III sliding clamp (beta) subunit (PCNA family)
MTLGETRDQISQLEVRLAQLKDEKHQLFLQLKKVLNEDDRRRQLVKESKYVFANNLFSEISLLIEGKMARIEVSMLKEFSHKVCVQFQCCIAQS